MGRTLTTSFCSSKPKNSLALLFFEYVFAWKLCQTVIIVYLPIQKTIMINMVNTSLSHDSIPSSQLGGASMLFFMQVTIVGVAVSASLDDKRFQSHDASVMSRWQDDDKVIAVQPMVISFLWEKQVSVAPKDVYRPSIFFFPHPYPLALAVNKSPAVYILSRALDGLWRENRGSDNGLLTTPLTSVKGIAKRLRIWLHLWRASKVKSKLIPYLTQPLTRVKVQ